MSWEYKTVKLRARGLFGGKFDETQLDATMNDLGRDNWELTSAFTTTEPYVPMRTIMAIFKRPR